MHCNLKNNKFASFSFDCSIKIYNSENFESKYLINAHNKYIIFIIQLKNENFISCSF